MSEVFISYVREDKGVVDKLSNSLALNGISVWLDREKLFPGIRWKAAIAQAIRSGTFFLSIHSKARAERNVSYVNEELTVAIEEIRKRPMSRTWLIPVKLDDTDIEPRSIGGGETILDLQYCDLSDWKPGIIALLRVLGVKDPILDDDPPEKSAMKHKRSFVAPGGTVENALNALKAISIKYGAKKIDRSSAYSEFTETVVHDLSSLGLLQSDYTDRTVRLVNPHGDQHFALAVAVAQKPAFKVAIDILQEDLNATAIDVGRAVSDALDRDWSEGSMRRNGHALRKWVFLLYPNLRSPKLGDKAYLYSRGLVQKRKRKGPTPLLTAEILCEVRDKIKPPFWPKKIAEMLGLSSETVRGFRRRNRNIWKEIFGDD